MITGTIILVAIFLAFSGIFSGLAIAYMSLDLGFLNRLVKQGNADAKTVLELRSSGMRLLTTLILGTTLANAFATILIGDHFSGFVASIISAILIFLLADVLPQAFASRRALRFGAICAPLIRATLFIFYPITQPVSFILRKVLGEEQIAKLSKMDLLSMIDDSQTTTNVAGVDNDERRIMRGSLLFSDKKVDSVLTPNTVVKTIPHTDTLTQEKILELKESGYSRIPVSADDPNHFVGILYLKDLIGLVAPISVREVMDNTVHFVHTNDPLDRVLTEFIDTKMHLFVVLDDFGGFEGIITIEDIVEEIIGQEIMDEDDDISDLRQFAKSRQKRKIG
ncbi:MAG: CNNM domain-containing protein [Candidatus Nomurabacteria bacterium]|nr:CNNM domain-containing protein [Candidatus Nomurabacteria bacterium]